MNRTLLATLLFAASVAMADGSALPGRMVEVGDGRRMHLYCEGSGSPTIVFESGAGEAYYSWATIQPAVAKSYRSCSYDRAGLGFSDARSDRSVAVLVDDLHELLQRAGEKPPYVLVGHSLGGLLVRRFAARHRDLVSGMVLVDSTSEHLHARLPPLPEETAGVQEARAKRKQQIAEWRANGTWEVMKFHSAVPKEIVKMLEPLTASGRWWDARFAESDLPDSKVELSAEEKRLTVPLIVLSAASFARVPWRSKERHELWLKARDAAQADLAALSPRSRRITAATSHHLHLDKPQIVIDAIHEVASGMTSK